MRENSIDIKSEWNCLKDYTRQTFDRLPALKPVFLENLRECGGIYQYDSNWDKATGKKPKELKHFDGK